MAESVVEKEMRAPRLRRQLLSLTSYRVPGFLGHPWRRLAHEKFLVWALLMRPVLLGRKAKAVCLRTHTPGNELAIQIALSQGYPEDAGD
jgi:hypothetical protein